MLRQAFEEAIDRNAMNKVVFAGTTQTGLHAHVAREPRLRREHPVHALQPERREEARRCSQASRIRPCTCSTATATDMLRLAQFIQAEEAAVGINVVIDPAVGGTSIAVSGNFDTFIQRPRDRRQHRPVHHRLGRDLGIEELRRLLEPATRSHPRQYPQGHDAEGTEDALPRSSARSSSTTGRSSFSTTP